MFSRMSRKRVLVRGLGTTVLIAASLIFSTEQSFGAEVLATFRRPAGMTRVSSTSAVGVQATVSKIKDGTVKVYEEISSGSENVIVTSIRSESLTEDELRKILMEAPDVEYVGGADEGTLRPATSRTSGLPNDYGYKNGQLWNLPMIHAPQAWFIATGRPEVHIAIMDSGIDQNHNDLSANINRTLSRNFYSEDHQNDYEDRDGHGTAVAGVAGAIGNNEIGTVGVAWNSKIIVLRITNRFQHNENNHGNPGWLGAFEHLLKELRNDTNLKIAAVNLSFSIELGVHPDDIKKHPIYIAVKALDDTDRILIVNASGNDGQMVTEPGKDNLGNTIYNYPALLPDIKNLIVVGSIRRDGSLASDSNWHPEKVHLLAPGDGIYTTALKSDSEIRHDKGMPEYGYIQGTSLATPHVVGAAALLLSIKPDANALFAGADRTKNPTRNGGMKASKYGLLNVYESMHKLNPKLVNRTPIPQIPDYQEQPEHAELPNLITDLGGGCNTTDVGLLGLALISLLILRRHKIH